MLYFKRSVVLWIILLALIISPTMLLAQDNGTITVSGSGIVAPVLQALATASGTENDLSVTTNGTAQGLADLCNGTVDIALATRPISVNEDGNCLTNGVQYTELLLGSDIATFIANPSDAFAQCLTTSVLANVFAPTAFGAVSNWTQLDASFPDTALSVFVPQDDLVTYLILDSMVEGDGLRSDAVSGTDAETIQNVSSTPGALGVVSYPAAVAAGDSVKILQVGSGAASSSATATPTGTPASDCVDPTEANVEAHLYTPALRLFVYVNSASRNKTGMMTLLSYIGNEESASVITSVNVTPPTSEAYAKNLTALQNDRTGRLFSQEVVTFEIPASVSGTVAVGGVASAYSYLNGLGSSLSSTYPNLTISLTFDGQDAGYRRFCNGELDIVLAFSAMTSDQQNNCAANNITSTSIALGSEATVLVAHAGDSYDMCLTPSQIATIWGDTSASTVTNWNQVDASFPDQDMTLFAPPTGNVFTDLLFAAGDDPNITERLDTQTNSDALYRAAATANVEGALTYMGWKDYLRVLANNQANIQLVSVSNGEACVSPSPDTIQNGSYPLARSTQLIVSQAALQRTEVQSYLWYMLNDSNYPLYSRSNLFGIEETALPDMRSNLQTQFKLAEQAAAAETTPEPGAESTAEATAESTSEAAVPPTTAPTTEPTVEPTTVPTVEATAEATAVPTVEPTTLPTSVPTAKPTATATDMPTAESTAEITPEATSASSN